jgi:hypothetical protein
MVVPEALIHQHMAFRHGAPFAFSKLLAGCELRRDGKAFALVFGGHPDTA